MDLHTAPRLEDLPATVQNMILNSYIIKSREGKGRVLGQPAPSRKTVAQGLEKRRANIVFWGK